MCVEPVDGPGPVVHLVRVAPAGLVMIFARVLRVHDLLPQPPEAHKHFVGQPGRDSSVIPAMMAFQLTPVR